ncbi:MAG TPA: hypothetical protein VHM19_01000, partial [Polyangiales bacterium]|nr:hypothetical protein [Polyangiales bacterium]
MADGDRKIPAVSWLTYEPFSTDFAKAAMDRFEAEQKRLKSSKRHDRIRRAWERVYSRDKNGACDNTLIQQRGTRGEILELQPNRFARILRDNMSDVRTSPPKFVPEALNSSAKSQDQAALGKGVLKWYERKLKLLDARIERVEIMQLASESVQHIWWDYQKGREAAVGNSAADGVQPIEVGSRVVATVNHMPGMAGRAGTVALVRDGDEQPFYAVLFDGESEPHKWLAADELEAEDSD